MSALVCGVAGCRTESEEVEVHHTPEYGDRALCPQCHAELRRRRRQASPAATEGRA